MDSTAPARRVRVEAADDPNASVESLRHALRSLQDFVETSSIGLHWVGPDGTILWANRADHEPLGYAREEWVGQDIRRFHADADVIADILMRLLRGERIHEYPARLVAKDGSVRDVVIDSSSYMEDGKLVHTRCFTRDVTERVRLEERQRATAATVETLLRVQQDLTRSLDLEGVVQAATDACTKLTGAAFGAFFYNVTRPDGESYMLYTLSGVEKAAFADFPLPRATPLFAPTFRGERILRSDDVTREPEYGRVAPHHGMPEGHLPVRSYLAVPVVGRDGVVHGGLFFGHPERGRFTKEHEEAVAVIAAQTAVALDNTHLYQRARMNEDRLRRLLENAPVQILTIDAHGRVVSANRSFRGFPADKAAGLDIYSIIDPDDRERVREAIAEVVRAREPAEFDARGLATAGGPRWFHVRVAPLESPDEKGAILLVTDVTDRKESEREIAAMRAQLIQGEKLSALGGLVSGLAHELRTPLTFLATNAFILKQRLDKAARSGASVAEIEGEASAYLAEITSGVDRINQLVEDLRRYTKARADRQLSVVTLDSVLGDAIELFRATNRHANPLETSLSRTCVVRVNRGAVQQVVLNLLQNAADATPPGGVLRIVTRDVDEGAVLEVVDQGEGIPPEVQKRMYEPLFTTKPQGTGLGLGIVKRIVDEHGGRIECESAPGKGTRFRVVFPKA